MKFPDLLLIGIPLYTISGLVELFWLTKRRGETYPFRDSFINIALFLTNAIFSLAYMGGIIAVWGFFYENRFYTFEYGLSTFVLVFFAEDFIRYWSHRFQHRFRYIWDTTHVIHHSSTHFNFMTASRSGWLKPLGGVWVLWGFLCLLGFPLELVLFQAGVSRMYQFFTHTRLIDRCPALFEFLFVTPSHHRVHHARNSIYIDKNYGGILILWDRLFGTFQEERKDVPCDYGILAEVDTDSILDVNFHGVRSLWRDVRARGVKTLILPPGWK